MTYIQPLLLVFLMIALTGLVLRKQGQKSRLPMVGFLGLLFLSWPPVDWLLSRPLERWYPVQPFPPAPAQAIVVLSSTVNPPRYSRPYARPDRETYQRCEFAAFLHRNWQPLPVLACGGPGTKRSKQAVSVTMRRLLQQGGVPEALIWTEERSGSTHENAVFGAEILRQHGIGSIALVVEAQAMPRAEACFRKQGIIVVAAPCEFRQLEASLEDFMPGWQSIKRNEDTLHEAVGLVWYWLHGWI
jgi:uncharacterized SAM-binding protein YcdF (DUF218 family)